VIRIKYWYLLVELQCNSLVVFYCPFNPKNYLVVDYQIIESLEK